VDGVKRAEARRERSLAKFRSVGHRVKNLIHIKNLMQVRVC
jgi:hypothetical protein